MPPRRVPFKPEPLAALKARLPAALAEPIDPLVELATQAGVRPEHAFDFEDGLRLVVTRTVLYRDSGGQLRPFTQAILASAYVEPESPLDTFTPRTPDGLKKFCAQAAARIRELLNLTPAQLGDAPKALTFGSNPHWFVLCDAAGKPVE